MNDKPTPRANAVWQKHKCLSPQSAADAYELVQQLERELAEARKEIERIVKWATINGVSQLEAELREARKEIERLKKQTKPTE